VKKYFPYITLAVVSITILVMFLTPKSTGVSISGPRVRAVPVPIVQDTVEVFDQRPGDTVTISHIIVSEPSAIQIYKQGQLIGETETIEQNMSTLVVQLDELVEEGDELEVVFNDFRAYFQVSAAAEGGINIPALGIPPKDLLQ